MSGISEYDKAIVFLGYFNLNHYGFKYPRFVQDSSTDDRITSQCDLEPDFVIYFLHEYCIYHPAQQQNLEWVFTQ